MMKVLKMTTIFFLFLLLTFTAFSRNYGENTGKNSLNESSRLLILWSSGDKEVAQNMVFMYTLNAKKFGWWDNIRLLVWGASSKLLAEDKDLQQVIQKTKESGIELYACKACADIYGVSPKLEELGITVKYMGEDFTNWIKDGWTTLTF